MADLWQQWGGDLVLGATGDILIASGSDLGNQRILRRLLTVAGDYIWQITYGAGLGALVGNPSSLSQLQALIRSQIFKELTVAPSPEPTVEVQSGASGFVYVGITYSQIVDGSTQILNFSIGG